jgi:uncharacterized cupin superfamily protein
VKVVAAASLDVPLEPVAVAQVVAGAPDAGAVDLWEQGGLEVGVWEHSVGVSSDVEADETFVVLRGRARIDVEGGESVDVGPGDVVRLDAGARTTWTVSEPLRKVYLVATD